jgi:mannose-6-phosphate isomerase-like protein (cupin superfamily)
MYSLHKSDARVMDLKGRVVKVFVGGGKIQSKRMTLGLTEVHPLTAMDPHTHDDKEEMIYVIEGRGEAMVGDSLEKLEPDTAVLFPVGMPHQVRNLGSIPLRFVFVFNPPNDFSSVK